MREDDPAREVILQELQRLAITTFGEERAAEVLLQNALRATATAVWRISQEPLEPVSEVP